MHRGTYHAFHQLGPFHPDRTLIHRGHATSPDLRGFTRWPGIPLRPPARLHSAHARPAGLAGRGATGGVPDARRRAARGPHGHGRALARDGPAQVGAGGELIDSARCHVGLILELGGRSRHSSSSARPPATPSTPRFDASAFPAARLPASRSSTTAPSPRSSAATGTSPSPCGPSATRRRRARASGDGATRVTVARAVVRDVPRIA
nr:hypothetical protein [Actinomyces radicidentis]